MGDERLEDGWLVLVKRELGGCCEVLLFVVKNIVWQKGLNFADKMSQRSVSCHFGTIIVF